MSSTSLLHIAWVVGRRAHRMVFLYKNHRGLEERRIVHPQEIVWGGTEHDPTPRFRLRAHCLDADDNRLFRMDLMTEVEMRAEVVLGAWVREHGGVPE